jgi:hypothetical protein
MLLFITRRTSLEAFAKAAAIFRSNGSAISPRNNC